MNISANFGSRTGGRLGKWASQEGWRPPPPRPAGAADEETPDTEEAKLAALCGENLQRPGRAEFLGSNSTGSQRRPKTTRIDRLERPSDDSARRGGAAIASARTIPLAPPPRRRDRLGRPRSRLRPRRHRHRLGRSRSRPPRRRRDRLGRSRSRPPRRRRDRLGRSRSRPPRRRRETQPTGTSRSAESYGSAAASRSSSCRRTDWRARCRRRRSPRSRTAAC